MTMEPTKPAFYWGIGIENCWMAEHNETNRAPKRLLDVFLQMQHYTMWREDLDKAAELGITAIRYSVPWYKANPKPGVFDWSWISQSLEYIVNELGLIPVIDLIHYGTPLWMDNSVLHHDYPERLADYAAAFARQFKGLVTHYTPHNEPQLGATYGGFSAYWPPYLTGIDGWVKVGLNIGRGMRMTTQALRAELPDVVLISADCLVSPDPADVQEHLGVTMRAEEREDFGYQIQSFPASLAYGKVRPDHPFGQALIRTGTTTEELAWFNTNAQLPDIVGHNYYPVCFDQEGITDEEGLGKAVLELQTRLERALAFFGRPVYLSETSAGYNDKQKAAWMHAACDVIMKLRAKDMPVVGMNWWPLFETVQWEYRDNTKTITECIYPGTWNNGLYTINQQFDGTLVRMRTDAVDAYRALVAAHQLS